MFMLATRAHALRAVAPKHENFRKITNWLLRGSGRRRRKREKEHERVKGLERSSARAQRVDSARVSPRRSVDRTLLIAGHKRTCGGDLILNTRRRRRLRAEVAQSLSLRA